MEVHTPAWKRVTRGRPGHIPFSKRVDMTYDEAIAKVTGELTKEGFGVLTEIDVKATLKKTLDVDFRYYIILGACNPQT